MLVQKEHEAVGVAVGEAPHLELHQGDDIWTCIDECLQTNKGRLNIMGDSQASRWGAVGGA